MNITINREIIFSVLLSWQLMAFLPALYLLNFVQMGFVNNRGHLSILWRGFSDWLYRGSVSNQQKCCILKFNEFHGRKSATRCQNQLYTIQAYIISKSAPAFRIFFFESNFQLIFSLTLKFNFVFSPSQSQSIHSYNCRLKSTFHPSAPVFLICLKPTHSAEPKFCTGIFNS